MFRLVVLACALAAASSQQYHGSPQTAAILTEQRYLSGDGTFGASYTQEDGVDFKEESDADGNRRGSYSYVDPTGQRRTVTYTAGKNGFQASGDHLPVAPTPVPVPAAQQQYHQQPQAHFNHQPQSQYNGQQDDGQYRPELYEQASYQPQQQQYRQPQQQYHQQPQFHAQPQQQYHQQPQFQAQQQYHQQPQAQYQHTTQAPHRFFPPGKLALSRTPDGFTYSFNKA